jgi:hypothetical protein
VEGCAHCRFGGIWGCTCKSVAVLEGEAELKYLKRGCW